MRVRVVDVEGTPEELVQVPDLLAALRGIADGSTAGGANGSEGIPIPTAAGVDLPDGLRDFIAARAGSHIEMVQAWVREVLGWGTEAELGTSRRTSDGLGNYIRLYARGPRRLGAFAYVTPGTAKVNFRLLRRDAEGFEHVSFRNVRDGTGYEVTIHLSSDAAYQEALRLARTAWERVLRA